MSKSNREQINIRIANNNDAKISLDAKFEGTICENFFEFNVGDLWITISLEEQDVDVAIHKERHSELEELFKQKIKVQKCKSFYDSENFVIEDLKKYLEKTDENFHEAFNVALIMPKSKKVEKVKKL